MNHYETPVAVLWLDRFFFYYFVFVLFIFMFGLCVFLFRICFVVMFGVLVI